MYTVCCITIHAGNLIPSTISGQMTLLFFCVATVAAQGEHQSDILFFYTGGIQLVQQGGHHFPCGHGASDIAGNDDNFLVGMYELTQLGSANRLLQRPPDFGLAGQRHHHLVGH